MVEIKSMLSQVIGVVLILLSFYDSCILNSNLVEARSRVKVVGTVVKVSEPRGSNNRIQDLLVNFDYRGEKYSKGFIGVSVSQIYSEGDDIVLYLHNGNPEEVVFNKKTSNVYILVMFVLKMYCSLVVLFYSYHVKECEIVLSL